MVGLKAKLLLALERFKTFCAYNKISFYAGMVFTVLGLLTLTTYLPLITSAALCPLLTALLYMIGIFATESPEEIKDNPFLKQGFIASLLGCGWVLLFVAF